MNHTPTLLWAPRAWLTAPTTGSGGNANSPPGHGAWHTGVCLESDAQGRWCAITPGVATPPAQATVLAGPVVPSLVNAHSHAFQRAFAGLSERRSSLQDDFWSWRERMYDAALRITPTQLRHIAAQLYLEMLQGGYTHVCEFHYLHHSETGQPYDDPAAMAWALADAAHDVGIGLTLLPVLYERAGFAQPALRHEQRRFASSPAFVADLQKQLHHQRPLLNAGVAIHSLRAATPESIRSLLQHTGDSAMPIHIHIAEQMAEVQDCLRSTGQRPLEWLCHTHPLDARWHLVHATHSQPHEIDAVARSGAGIVICPSTEANLGDGLADLPRWWQAQVPMSIGSDSQVCRQWPQELRWLEYGQRLHLQRRNIAATPTVQPSSAAQLLDTALHASAPAAGESLWGLQTGARADALVLNPHTPGLLGIPPSHTLDAFIFTCDQAAIRDVYVAGQATLREQQHPKAEAIARQFGEVMVSLWG